MHREESPTLTIGGRSFDEFLASRSRNFREQVRRRERKLRREHEVEIRLSDAERLDADLDTLFRLHEARWSEGESEALSGARASASTATSPAGALERGWLRLWVLEADGAPRAAWYGFRFAQMDWYYQSGRDPEWERQSVGFVLLSHTIRQAFDDGMLEYRLLRGGEEYKGRFASDDPGSRRWRCRAAWWAAGHCWRRRLHPRGGCWRPGSRARCRRPDGARLVNGRSEFDLAGGGGAGVRRTVGAGSVALASSSRTARSTRSTARSIVNSASRSCAASAIARRRSGSRSSASSASAIAAGSRGGTSSALVPFSKMSRRPPTSVATIGVRAAMHSNANSGMPSKSELIAATSRPASTTGPSLRIPSQCTRPSSPRARACSCHCAVIGP